MTKITTVRARELANKYAIVLVLAGLVCLIGALERTFLSLDNLGNNGPRDVEGLVMTHCVPNEHVALTEEPVGS